MGRPPPYSYLLNALCHVRVQLHVREVQIGRPTKPLDGTAFFSSSSLSSLGVPLHVIQFRLCLDSLPQAPSPFHPSLGTTAERGQQRACGHLERPPRAAPSTPLPDIFISPTRPCVHACSPLYNEQGGQPTTTPEVEIAWAVTSPVGIRQATLVIIPSRRRT